MPDNTQDTINALLKIAESLDNVAEAIEKDAATSSKGNNTHGDDYGYGTVSSKVASGGYDNLTEFCLR